MISLIIPTYNERENVTSLVARIEKIVKQKHEIIFVDDNSPDGTAAVIHAIVKNNKNVRLVTRKEKAGLASAVLAGFKASQGSIIVVMDADLSHPMVIVPQLVEEIEKGADIVVAGRYIKGGGTKSWPIHRKIISSGATAIAKIVLSIDISDPLSGFFAVKRSCFEKMRFRIKGYKILLNVLTDNRKAVVKEVPFVFEDRKTGKSKLSLNEIVFFIKDVKQLL